MGTVKQKRLDAKLARLSKRHISRKANPPEVEIEVTQTFPDPATQEEQVTVLVTSEASYSTTTDMVNNTDKSRDIDGR